MNEYKVDFEGNSYRSAIVEQCTQFLPLLIVVSVEFTSN